jgi:heme/copper-type cytochrome/quinol oxidase subunit 2
VFAAMIGSVIAFTPPRQDTPDSASAKTMEIFWALIPIAIVLAAAMPALRTISFAGGGETAQAESQSVRSESQAVVPRSPAAFAQALNKK